jgi:hypothetical protein
MSRSKTLARQSSPWWLGGEEECPHCHQLYAYEIEVRCPECDEPSCPHCVRQHVERGIVCVICNESCEGTQELSGG